MAAIEDFRAETRAWLEDNCPPGGRGPGPIAEAGSKIETQDKDALLWLERMVEKGWTTPTWPREYGGDGLSNDEFMVLIQEMSRIGARAPLAGYHGMSLVGPTLLEFGTGDQMARHLPPIARGEVRWCQGYSEPSAGSDLASLRTRAVDAGDHFIVNGQKIWTSGANFADWIFVLVRTGPNVPKHDGISFVLMDMDQPGITVRPIRLIGGASTFCETFFDDAIARKDDLVGELNKGWTIGKRLLQHERGSMASLVGGGAAPERDPSLAGEAKRYAGESQGRIIDATLRHKVIKHNMNDRAFRLTQRRAVEEARGGGTPGPATSIFKVYGTELEQEKTSLFVEMRGSQGLGWSDDAFSKIELEHTRNWLAKRAASIYSGSNEIQRNIIAKRVLGLPD